MLRPYRALLRDLVLASFIILPSGNAFALGDGLTIFGNVGTVRELRQKNSGIGGYGQAGLGLKTGGNRVAFIAHGRRLSHFSSKNFPDQSFRIEMDSLGIEDIYQWGRIGLEAVLEMGTLTMYSGDDFFRYGLRGGQIGMSVTLFDNSFFRIYTNFGSFLLRPDNRWQETYNSGDIQGAFLAVGVDLSEPDKNF